jgi:hypothetical protein
MYITAAMIDNTDTFDTVEYSDDQLSASLVENLVRQLDGATHTLVMLFANGDSHMAIGGSYHTGLVVYKTDDNRSFDRLVSTSPHSTEKVPIVAGGQPAEFERRYVVTADQAVRAATSYAIGGAQPDGSEWSHE